MAQNNQPESGLPYLKSNHYIVALLFVGSLVAAHYNPESTRLIVILAGTLGVLVMLPELMEAFRGKK